MNKILPIKYRAIRLDNNCWAYGYYIQKRETTYCFKEDYDAHPNNTKHYILWDEMTDWGLPNKHLVTEVDKNTICQFIGIYDKNKKEIYTNDIVKTKYGRLCVVTYFSSASYCGFDLEPIDCEYKCPDKYDLWLSNNLEVVGNTIQDESI